MLSILLTMAHVAGCLVLIGVVLLQTGKRADLAGAFGGGGSQTAFGTRGAATFLSKATTATAVLFMVTSMGLSIVATRASGSSGSVLDDHPAPASETAPAPEDSGSGLPALPPLSEEPAASDADATDPAATGQEDTEEP